MIPLQRVLFLIHNTSRATKKKKTQKRYKWVLPSAYNFCKIVGNSFAVTGFWMFLFRRKVLKNQMSTPRSFFVFLLSLSPYNPFETMRIRYVAVSRNYMTMTSHCKYWIIVTVWVKWMQFVNVVAFSDVLKGLCRI